MKSLIDTTEKDGELFTSNRKNPFFPKGFVFDIKETKLGIMVSGKGRDALMSAESFPIVFGVTLEEWREIKKKQVSEIVSAVKGLLNEEDSGDELEKTIERLKNKNKKI